MADVQAGGWVMKALRETMLEALIADGDFVTVTLPDGATDEQTKAAAAIANHWIKRMYQAELNVLRYGAPGFTEDYEWEMWDRWKEAQRDQVLGVAEMLDAD